MNWGAYNRHQKSVLRARGSILSVALNQINSVKALPIGRKRRVISWSCHVSVCKLVLYVQKKKNEQGSPTTVLHIVISSTRPNKPSCLLLALTSFIFSLDLSMRSLLLILLNCTGNTSGTLDNSEKLSSQVSLSNLLIHITPLLQTACAVGLNPTACYRRHISQMEQTTLKFWTNSVPARDGCPTNANTQLA